MVLSEMDVSARPDENDGADEADPAEAEAPSEASESTADEL